MKLIDDQSRPRPHRTHTEPTAVLLVAAFVCLWLLSTSTQAGIRACKQADGSVVFQDSACEIIKKAQTNTKTQEASIPFGIEKSWFDKPPVVPDRAICTISGCHCGMFSRKFKHGLPLAIADSLYLDGSWHRLESTLQQLELSTNSSIELADLRRERDEAACNILMSQRTLRLYGADVMKSLNTKKRYAEDRGLDDPADCEAGDMVVCEHTDSITLFERMKSDIRSLTLSPRVGAAQQDTLANSAND